MKEIHCEDRREELQWDELIHSGRRRVDHHLHLPTFSEGFDLYHKVLVFVLAFCLCMYVCCMFILCHSISFRESNQQTTKRYTVSERLHFHNLL